MSVLVGLAILTLGNGGASRPCPASIARRPPEADQMAARQNGARTAVVAPAPRCKRLAR